ncbi:MAG: endonuclease/exonuclease/phosphatase family protein [Psychrobacter sp.]|nr:endonuclease/exonuclease/phosphatase family protein [Psychrobacter sp.]MBP7956110.1 endonuclease/exonuclease/phosphatase family protein [Psychrobacter sp.]MBP8046460.1 endonuclease/exonuclease/phosphatase family protein [Psychrobacter sp.]MBP8816137.1 endonuclease/exonuclease/phosphatase family protein [Psychrobacter sp.]MBP9646839.1 endonuclease/exonuclease/phosphatase family protein [Psychrobacter sp.]
MVNNAEDNSPKQFYIATANLLNFANPNRIYYENAPAYSDNEYQHKLRGITDLLAKAHADIIAVQEVWDSHALEALAVALGFEPEHVVIPLASNDKASPYTQGKGAQQTPAVGIITRFEQLESTLLEQVEPKAVIDIPDIGLYQRFNRPPLVLRVNAFGQPITIVTAHLKSKRAFFLRDENGQLLEDMDDPNIRVRAKLRSLCMRAAEAASIRMSIIQRLHHTREPLILLGDMNDVTGSVTTQLMSETGEVNYDKSMRDVALFDAARIQARYDWMKDVAYTHIYQGMPEVIDQLFVSEEFLPDSKFSLGQVERVDYFNDHLKWDYADRVIDHGIIRAKIKLHS